MYVSPGLLIHSANGPFGRVLDLVVAWRRQRLTHLVVKPQMLPAAYGLVARLLPFALLETTGDGMLLMRCTENVFAQLPPLAEGATLAANSHNGEFDGAALLGARTQVILANGRVGKFSQIAVSTADGQIEQLAFYLGHAWERQQTWVAAAAIERIEGDAIVLK